MPQQKTLPLSDDPPLPEFKPMHPSFKGQADVLAFTAHKVKNIDGPRYRVDLDANVCTCQNGGTWSWNHKFRKYEPAPYCTHKLRAIADIVERGGCKPDAMFGYTKALALRYNMYEVVSAFHKELRYPSEERAVFWGSILMTFRGINGVYKYLLNIAFEETRDWTLARWLLDQLISENLSYEGMCKAIVLFCRSKKKWELKHRYGFLEAEMRGYAKLVEKYGRDVAKGSDIIPANQYDHLTTEMLRGLKGRDYTLYQYGLKGLQKIVVNSNDKHKLDKHRAVIINRLHEQTSASVKKRDGYDEIYQFISDRGGNGHGIGYHELNAYADFLAGEAFDPGNTPPETFAAVLAAPAPKIRLGVAPQIPHYAHDNHTWAGKALLRRFPNEWQPGADQQNFDLRLCGAYMGVVWRHLAFRQFECIDCAWKDVKWPAWLHETVANLWY